jgi:hypothetical protein
MRSSIDNIKISSISARIDELSHYVLKLDNQLANQTYKLDYIIRQLTDLNNRTHEPPLRPDDTMYSPKSYRVKRNTMSSYVSRSPRDNSPIRKQSKLPRINKTNLSINRQFHMLDRSTSSSGSDHDVEYLEVSPTVNTYKDKKSSNTNHKLSRRSFDATSSSAARAPTLSNFNL